MINRVFTKFKTLLNIKMNPQLPLVVILGSTGSGKTKLSLELATKFGGEIVGADSMQVYKELDIASAKATSEELALVPHHMINILGPEQRFTVLEYRNMVLPILDDIIQKGKLPIIVGGTNYYIESVLWKVLVQEPGEIVRTGSGMLPNDEHQLPSHVLHEKLKKLDPAMAKRLHPNNQRKILRSLEILYQKGKKHSEIIDEQCTTSKSGGGLRFHNAIVLWLQCNQEVLDQRLNERVDRMINEGLLDELSHFHQLCSDNVMQVDYTKGIFQSIGFKEFSPYFLLPEEEKNSDKGEKVLEQCVEVLKLVTRRYARKQTKWTVNRFLARKDRQVPPIYGLDTTDVSKWNDKVSSPACRILESFINKTKCPIEPLPKQDKESIPNTMEETFKCETCDKILVGTRQWQIHMNSNKHKRVLQSKKRSIEKVERIVD